MKAPVRRLPAALLLLAVLLAALAGSLLLGARPLPPAALADFLAGTGTDAEQAVLHSRLARTTGALLLGAALGLAGTGLQGLTRNPLADPGILGLNAGASLGVVTVLALGAASTGWLMAAAFAGAGIVMALAYLLASLGKDGATPIKLALAGAALAVGAGSLVNALLMVSKSTLDEYRFWQVGSLAARGLEAYLPALPLLAAGAVLVLACTRVCNALALGDDAAS